MTRDKLNAIIAAIKKLREVAGDDVALTVPEIYPEWNGDGLEYKTGDRVLFEGKLYKCLQTHTSQSTWTPTTAPSLWAAVLVPDPEVIPEWVQPESTNPYMIGDKVKHNDKTWISTVDNNIWEPGVYGWDIVEG